MDEKYEPIRRGGAPPGGIGPQVPESGSSKPPDIGKRMYEKMAGKKSADPMLEPTGDEPDKWDKDYNQKTGGGGVPTPVTANAYGTKYHKESKTAKFWYEAKNEDGVSYYYNVTSGESRWAGVICLYHYFEIFLLVLISFPTAKSFLQRIFGPSSHRKSYKPYNFS